MSRELSEHHATFQIPRWSGIVERSLVEIEDSRALPGNMLRPNDALFLASTAPNLISTRPLRPIKFDPAFSNNNSDTSVAILMLENCIVVSLGGAVIKQDVFVYRASVMINCVHFLFHDVKEKLIKIDISDFGSRDALSFCGTSDVADGLLIPDVDYIRTAAYHFFRKEHLSRAIPFGERINRLYWRGTATPHGRDAVSFVCPSLKTVLSRSQRLKLCSLAEGNCDIDARVTSLDYLQGGLNIPPVKKYLSEPVPQYQFGRYKYVVDIDGWSNSWQGLFTKLYAGSVVFKVASQLGFRQWFYPRLSAWTHFIPISDDMSDLYEILDWCQSNDAIVEQIAEAGHNFAANLTLQSELDLFRKRAIDYDFSDSCIEQNK